MFQPYVNQARERISISINLVVLIMAAVVMLISSCKTTTSPTTNASTSNTNTITEKTVPSPALSSINQKEKDALRLLGRSGGMYGQNPMNPDGSIPENFKCFFEVGKELDEVLKKDIADNLQDVVNTFAKKCPQNKISFYVEKNPTIQEIQTILGKENETEKEKIGYPDATEKVEVTWYKYHWLDFGVANFGIVKGKVVVLRVYPEKMK